MGEEEEEEELEEEVEDKAGRIADVRISYRERSREQTGGKDESHRTWKTQKVFREFCPFKQFKYSNPNLLEAL